MKDKSLVTFLLTSFLLTVPFMLLLSKAAMPAASTMAAIAVYVSLTHLIANKCTKLSERKLGILNAFVCVSAPCIIIIMMS